MTASWRSHLPLRVRLVAGFSAAMMAVLAAAGVFVYWRVELALDNGLDTDLLQATGTIIPRVGADGRVSDRILADATGVAWQVLSADGYVLDRGGAAGTDAMVSPSRLAHVGTSARTLDIGDILDARDTYRVRISPLTVEKGDYLLVGVRRDHRDEALRELLVTLLFAGIGALVITGFVGDRLARAALLPVERYRRQAAAIAEGATELRLDVPTERDDEVTRLGHTFNDMLASLERALDRERQFVGDASHELRTPITLLGSRIQLARRRPRTTAEHEEVLDELQVDLDRLAHLADQLLAVGASSGAGGQGCDLVAVTARVIDQRRVADVAHLADVGVVLPDRPVPVALSDAAVERVLTNLLDNAAKHGAPPVEVVVDRPDPGWARIVVTDAGRGMEPDLLHTAVQRFARADDARARPGAGLGLSLVDSLVTGAGGELRLCFDGHHAFRGAHAPVPCEHGRAMSVTVLLPGH
ncbi:MAG: ATP-binding protein [Promicromonosporaceae bacterium]|nr:ATP-binding protein [Promicromonosporaceae bacterium]